MQQLQPVWQLNLLQRRRLQCRLHCLPNMRCTAAISACFVSCLAVSCVAFAPQSHHNSAPTTKFLQLSPPVQELDAVSREVESLGPAAAECNAALAAMAAREQALAILAAQAEERLQVRRPGEQAVHQRPFTSAFQACFSGASCSFKRLCFQESLPDSSLLNCNVSPAHHFMCFSG